MFEISKATVDQPARYGGRATAEIILLEDDNSQASHRCVARDAGTIYSGTNDGKVKFLVRIQLSGLTRQAMVSIEARQRYFAFGYGHTAASCNSGDLSDIACIGDKVIDLRNTACEL